MSNKPPNETIDALERLQRLKDSGLLSDEELAQQKAEVLANQKAASGRAPNPADSLSVRPETLRKISESQRSGGGHGALWALLAVGVLGIGGYFGARALNIEIPGLPAAWTSQPKADSDVNEPDGGSSTPTSPEIELDVSMSQETNPGNLSETFTILEIQSKMDSVTVESVTVNRGNCKALNWKDSASSGDISSYGQILQLQGLMSLGVRDIKAPPNLDFGETAKLVYSRCDILEVEILTDRGGAAYTFE